jgi:hypothetical protein
MKIETDRAGLLLERLPVIVLTEEDQRNGALEACGAAVFDARKWTWSVEDLEVLHR